jgi:asparagine synthase (glutamine-hydrolysing)
MCGICGVWKGEGRDAVRAMLGAMHHRGPDDSGVLEDDNVVLGMTRLAILDTSSGGHQPMLTPNGQIAIVYNGELYNFRDERSLLEQHGYDFRSNCDTEVVLHMYEHYGDDFLLRMRGMFALAVYDKRQGPGRERLLLARDQMGIKPLLYALAGRRIVFGSEMKAMLASGLVEREVDPVSLRMLLAHGSVYQPRTMLRGVQMLLPAHRLIMEGDREPRVERYWSLGLDRHPGLRARSYEEQVEELTVVLEESVRLQMVSDVPIGAFLSGGLDSSLLVALMIEQVGGNRLKTFSVGFEAEGSAIDETDEADRTARFLGTDHTRVLVTGEDVRDRIGNIARALDQPSVDGVNSYFVSLAARQAVTVAISGTGGDELFAGYPWFGLMLLDEVSRRKGTWKSFAESLLASVAKFPVFDPILERRGGELLCFARSRVGFLPRYNSTYQVFGTGGAARVLSLDLRGSAGSRQPAHNDLDAVDELPGGSVLERVTGLCLRGYTTNQLLRDIDAVSMAHSLEVRVPYLDPVVADAALSLPNSAKLATPPNARFGAGSYRQSGIKRILQDIARPRLPEGFDMLTKRGFGMPFARWLNGPLNEVLQDSLSEERVRRRGLLDPSAVAAVKLKFTAGSQDWLRPWLLMMLELWHQEVLDRPADSFAHAAGPGFGMIGHHAVV